MLQPALALRFPFQRLAPAGQQRVEDGIADHVGSQRENCCRPDPDVQVEVWSELCFGYSCISSHWILLVQFIVGWKRSLQKS